jgi:hypothetical protein
MGKSHYSLIFVIADNQEPFGHKDYLEFCKHVFEKYGQNVLADQKRVVHAGDEVDQHSLGRWPSDPAGRSGGDELEEAKLKLRDWYKAFPRVSLCVSNHSFRAWKRAFQAGIPQQFLKEIGDVYDAPPGWKWADRWIIDGICFEHGENVSGETAALKAAKQNRMKTVIGHQHTHAGVIYSGSIHDEIWGLNVGCGIDVDAYAFRYGRALRNKPNLGCGVILEGVPFFIPMILDKHKRWIGK